MQNFKTLGEELERSGKRAALEELAKSSEGRKIQQMLDADELKKAAEQGDTALMQSIVKNVLATDEGKTLAQNLMKLIQG